MYNADIKLKIFAETFMPLRCHEKNKTLMVTSPVWLLCTGQRGMNYQTKSLDNQVAGNGGNGWQRKANRIKYPVGLGHRLSSKSLKSALDGKNNKTSLVKPWTNKLQHTMVNANVKEIKVRFDLVTSWPTDPAYESLFQHVEQGTEGNAE